MARFEKGLASFGRVTSRLQAAVAVIIAIIIVLVGVNNLREGTGNGGAFILVGLLIGGFAVAISVETKKSQSFAEAYGALEGASLLSKAL